MIIRFVLLVLTCMVLSACATTVTKNPSDLNQLREDYLNGYYKKAFQRALPLAEQGSIEAEYTVGYLYYYGYGTKQNTDAGYKWIKQAADQHYFPAQEAMYILHSEHSVRSRSRREYIEENAQE